jgi:hypothetical protein
MKKTIVWIIVALLIILGIYYYINSSKTVTLTNEQKAAELLKNQATTTATTTPVNKVETVVGKSVDGKDITAYHYGTGADEILLVAGIHGGYAWNTTLMAYSAMDYLKANPSVIPTNVKVTIIPVLNPDGLNKVVDVEGRFKSSDVSSSQALSVAGRFNANEVDLNRNFDCDWKSTGMWQSKTVSGGTAAFSESESLAVKNYIETSKPKAVIAYYASAGGVYSSSCNNGISTETKAMNTAYAKASAYPSYSAFNDYATTGDLTNWLAKINVPAISILLTNHTDTDWSKNQAGITAIIKYYTK